MNRLELLLLVFVAFLVFTLTMVSLLLGYDGARLGIALAILGVVAGYIGKGLMFYMKKK